MSAKYSGMGRTPHSKLEFQHCRPIKFILSCLSLYCLRQPDRHNNSSKQSEFHSCPLFWNYLIKIPQGRQWNIFEKLQKTAKIYCGSEGSITKIIFHGFVRLWNLRSITFEAKLCRSLLINFWVLGYALYNEIVEITPNQARFVKNCRSTDAIHDRSPWHNHNQRQ